MEVIIQDPENIDALYAIIALAAIVLGVAAALIKDWIDDTPYEIPESDDDPLDRNNF